MRRVAHGVVELVIGDDVWVAVAVLVLLVAAAAPGWIGSEAWWLLPVGVPAALWISLVRARRAAHS